MNVIVEQSEIADFDSDGNGEQFESQLDPLFAVIEVLAGDWIKSAEECPSHAAVVAMINTYFIGVDDVLPWTSWHK